MKTLLITLLFTIYSMLAFADTTQNNTSGSNTNISGGYTSSATNTYQSGSSNNTTTTNNSTSNIKSAPPTAAAPNVTNSGSDVCLAGASAGIQTFGVGVSGGKHFIDKNCERLKLARILNDFGMKVAAVAILCQDERVFESMIQAGTPCPIDGKIGKEAKVLWSKYDHERPDYDIYVKRMKEREIKEEEIAKKAALTEKKRLEEQAKMTEELEKIDKEQAIEDLKNFKNVR